MRLSNSEHESHAWRIGEVAPDFRLVDAWALPAQGRRQDFATLLEVIASLDPAHARSRATRALFAIRYRVGGWLGWDEQARPLAIPDDTDATLSARLPHDLRGTAAGRQLNSYGFRPLYQTDVEAAAEVSNRTVHGVMQLAWVEHGGGVYRGRMGVYVKPRGRLGQAYMAAIAPFRHLVVYPAA
ncbi:MAG TPA: DUF2867 domain-containing protein [Solirubrobacteraceae bacterium]|nr:DUF2867 domain-containing protein [Solirubrobacteraceae bacterium]